MSISCFIMHIHIFIYAYWSCTFILRNMAPYVVYEFIMRIAQYGSICSHKVFLAQYESICGNMAHIVRYDSICQDMIRITQNDSMFQHIKRYCIFQIHIWTCSLYCAISLHIPKLVHELNIVPYVAVWFMMRGMNHCAEIEFTMCSMMSHIDIWFILDNITWIDIWMFMWTVDMHNKYLTCWHIGLYCAIWFHMLTYGSFCKI